MSRFHSYINSATSIIETFKGDRPFASFLKQFFAADSKYGSRDRRQISSLCYHYFRMGAAGAGIEIGEKMLIAAFLCETAPSELLENLQPEWNEKIACSVQEKLALIDKPIRVEDIFPFGKELSDGIDPGDFCRSFLVQPDLFIRIRPQTKISATKKLEKAKINWNACGEDCVQFNSAEKMEDLFIIDKEVVVQDYNSQKVLDYLKTSAAIDELSKLNPKGVLAAWDCCAASGGKSILLNDITDRKIDLTISDIRANIVLMLHRRFKTAGIKEYKYFIDDITSAGFNPGEFGFDLVICDAPCTGSGTWSRTPEQLYFFKPAAIREYQKQQQQIVSSVFTHLKPGGLLVYITCSVFKQENEAIAEYIIQNLNCEMLQMELLEGYDKRADSMFVAVFRKK